MSAYTIHALADRRAELLIYGDIGESWDDSTTSARTFVEQISGLDVDTIELRINSYGGSVTDGLAIFNALRRHPATVTTTIDGIAASIASLIAMAGDTIEMPANAMLMIHAPWGMSVGNASVMRDMADVLDRHARAMTSAYQRAGVDPDTITAWLTDGRDHWLDADEALSAGLIDHVAPALDIAASIPERYRLRARSSLPAAAAAPTSEDDTMSLASPVAAEPTQPVADPATPKNSASDAKSEARAAIAARNAAIKDRFEAFCQANPEHIDTVRRVYDAALPDLDQTPDQFTTTTLAALAEARHTSGEDQPIAGAYRTNASIIEDQRDKLKDACARALLARAALTREDINGNPFRGKTLARIAEDSLVRAGVRVEGLDPMQIVAAAFTQSSSDFPVLMENTMHKALLSGYAIASDTWRRFCAVGSVSDFRAHNRYMIGSIGDLQDLSETGEFKNASIPDGRKQSVSIGTKGQILNLTRQAIINDDLGAFVGLAEARGRAAARTIENAVYTALGLNSGYGPLLSDGKTIIHADHGNIAGTAGAPSVATVEAGVLAMAAQTDISGHDYLDLTPSILLVPKGLELTARVLNTSTNDPAATGSSKNFLTPNPYQGFFADIVSSQRLAATKWYMLASPTVAPVLEVSFLNGVQEPLMEMENGFSVDGARWKTRLDFGVSGVGYEGIVYNAGA